jgi:hypothetical protein
MVRTGTLDVIGIVTMVGRLDDAGRTGTTPKKLSEAITVMTTMKVVITVIAYAHSPDSDFLRLRGE